MAKSDVINYIMESPQNTNPAVLDTILTDFAGEFVSETNDSGINETVIVPAQLITIEDDVVELSNVNDSDLLPGDFLFIKGVYNENNNRINALGCCKYDIDEINGNMGYLEFAAYKSDDTWYVCIYTSEGGQETAANDYAIEITSISEDAENTFFSSELSSLIVEANPK